MFARVPKCGFKASNSLHCLVVALKNNTSDTKECLAIYVIYATYIHVFKMSSLKNWLGSSELDGDSPYLMGTRPISEDCLLGIYVHVDRLGKRETSPIPPKVRAHTPQTLQ